MIPFSPLSGQTIQVMLSQDVTDSFISHKLDEKSQLHTKKKNSLSLKSSINKVTIYVNLSVSSSLVMSIV